MFCRLCLFLVVFCHDFSIARKKLLFDIKILQQLAKSQANKHLLIKRVVFNAELLCSGNEGGKYKKVIWLTIAWYYECKKYLSVINALLKFSFGLVLILGVELQYLKVCIAFSFYQRRQDGLY